MRKILTFLVLVLPVFVAGQTLNVAEFVMNERDLTAIDEETKLIDDNGDLCALIKIETVLKGFSFEGGYVGIAQVDESKVGEIWVYVPAGLRRITIKHPQFGVLRDYSFPEKLQQGRTYIMKLLTGSVEQVVQQKASTQWYVLKFEPDNAMLEVDGTIVDCDNGLYKKALSLGNHTVRISAKNYHTEVANVRLDGNGTRRDTIRLSPAFGWIEVKGPNEAAVFVDNEKIGVAPVKSEPIASGQHDLRVTKENWLPYREQVMVNDNAVTTVNPSLVANFVTITLKTGNNGEIWINGEKRGEGSVSVDLSPGEYTFESRKASHRSQSIARTITMASEGTIDIPAPVAIVGSMSIDVEPMGAKVYIDDKYVGEAPLVINDVLVGEHTVRTVYDELQDEERKVNVEQGETSEIGVKMSKAKKTTAELNNIEGIKISNGRLSSVPRDFKGHFVIGDDVTEIGGRAFNECTGLTGVTIPNSVTKIGWQAFKGCTGLTGVTIPNSVTSIGESAFSGCTGLTSVNIPNSVTEVGVWAFAGCTGIEKPIFNNSILVYYPWSSTGTYTVPSGITTIAGGAFSTCKLSKITIPNSVINIGEKAFFNMKELTEPIYNNTVFACMPISYKGAYTVPSGIEKITNYAFVWCRNLTSVTIPNSVTSVEDLAFQGCEGITEPIYNNTVFAFMPISYKGAYTIPSGIKTIAPYAFWLCESLTSITIPNSVKKIGKGAFDGCEKLSSVKISERVETIDEFAFSRCIGLTSVIIPKSVTSIGFDTFGNCTSLTSVTFQGGTTNISSDPFYESVNIKVIYVPKGSMEHYKTQLPENMRNKIVEK